MTWKEFMASEIINNNNSRNIIKVNKYIEIVTSPIGSLHLMPQKILASVHEALSAHYSKVEISIIHNEEDLNELVRKNPDLVVSGIKYLGFDMDSIQRNSKNKIWFSEFLDKHNIRYTGSSKNSLELEFDKSQAKKRVTEYGIKTAPFFIAKPDQYKSDEIPIEYPLFIKPLFEGDSRGIDSKSLVYNFEEYQEKVLSIYENQNTEALVEKYLSGKEYTVGVIQNFENKSFQINPIELLAEKNDKNVRILGFDDKIADNELALDIDNENIKSLLSKLALDSFKALGAKGYGRIDIKMDEKGIPYFLEANLIPGLGFGYFYRCYKLNGGISHEQMILDIVRNSFSAN